MQPILMYHALWPVLHDRLALQQWWDADPQLREPGARLYALDQATFARHLALLAAGKWNFAREWGDVWRDGCLLLSFDDGHRSNYELALPLLREHGATAAFFITTDWIDTTGFMRAEQLVELDRAGMLLGTHGCGHAYFSDLSEGELLRELRDSKAKLEDVIGKRVVSLALPGGSNHPRIAAAARQTGYAHVHTSRIGLVTATSDPFDLPRIPVTNRQPPEFIAELARRDFSRVEAMARQAARRAWARRLLGNGAYDRVRKFLIRR